MRIKAIKNVELEAPIPVYDIVNCAPNHNFLVATKSGSIVSHNCDEVNFSAMTTNVESMKKKPYAHCFEDMEKITEAKKMIQIGG